MVHYRVLQMSQKAQIFQQISNVIYHTLYTEKKREPKWLSWRVILKIGSLLWGRATFFLHNHVYRGWHQNGAP